MYKKIRNLTYALLVLLCGVLFIVNFVAFSFSGTITAFLCGTGLDYNSQEANEAREGARAVALEIAEDGITMLKNINNTLPLAANEQKLAVFGWGGCPNGFQYMGGGSGAGSGAERTTLYDALRAEGYTLYDGLVNYYNGIGYRRSANTTVALNQYYQVYEPPVSDALMNGAAGFTDVALFVITRRGTEGTDLTKWQYDENGNQRTDGRSYAEISVDEENLLNTVKQKFKKVIVVFNVNNVMEQGFLDDEKIGAALMLYTPGNYGTPAVGKVLKGTVNPSGHLVDTIAYDMSTAPTYVNAGSDGMVSETYRGVHNMDYAEDIYVGYYWYETADADGFWDSQYAKDRWNLTNGYRDVVQYPFGFGLSYADFKWEVLETNYVGGSTLPEDGEVQFKVAVTNTSETYAGKDVVQLYLNAPYYKGKIEKTAQKLVAFAKTGLLNPGQEEVLTLSVKVRDFASYDCFDRNNNGFMGYETEGGEYTLSLRTDVHTLKTVAAGYNAYTYTIPKRDALNTGYQYRMNEDGTYEIVNRFTNYTAPSGASSHISEPTLSTETKTYSCDGGDAGQNIVYLTRNNFSGTFPTAKNVRAFSARLYAETYKVGTPKKNASDQMPLTDQSYRDANNQPYTIQLSDMIVDGENGEKILYDINDEHWDKRFSNCLWKS